MSLIRNVTLNGGGQKMYDDDLVDELTDDEIQRICDLGYKHLTRK